MAYISLPIPFVPPVTNAFFESSLQKLDGGGGGTEPPTNGTMANAAESRTKRTDAEVMLLFGCGFFFWRCSSRAGVESRVGH